MWLWFSVSKFCIGFAPTSWVQADTLNLTKAQCTWYRVHWPLMSSYYCDGVSREIKRNRTCVIKIRKDIFNCVKENLCHISVSSVFLKHSSVLPAEQQKEGVCLCLCYVIQSGSTSGRKKVDLYHQTAFQVICKMRNGTWLGMRLIQFNILYHHKYFIKYIHQ